MNNRTYFRMITVGIVQAAILPKDKRRISLTITNKTTIGSTIWIGQSIALTSSSNTDFTAISLLQNESITLLESDGDDCTTEFWAIALVNTIVEIVETVGF